MKEKYIIIMATIIAMLFSYCTGSKQIKTKDTINPDSVTLDTINNGEIPSSVVYDISQTLTDTRDSLNNTIDTLYNIRLRLIAVTKTRDSLIKVHRIEHEALGIAQYKLLRIREYNRIAAKGNNIKFLRGWIIRTLK